MSDRKLIYHPSGRAGAYANSGYAANIYKGCTHGCKYCYVPGFCRINRDQFHASSIPAPNMLQRLEKDMKRVGVLAEPLFLCFTCDPYCEGAPHMMTREAIEIIHRSGNRVNILTKGGFSAVRDFDLLSEFPGNKIGATLTFADEDMSLEWEPRAKPPIERLQMLEDAKRDGIETWASIEPVIDPDESLEIMALAMPYVDEFKIGKWNHDKAADAIDWRKFAGDAVALMEKNGKRYVLKDDLRKYL